MTRLVCLVACVSAIAFVGCDDGTVDPTDSGTGGGDAGMVCQTPPDLPEGTRPDPSAVSCPTEATPAPDEQMGSCCWRNSNAGQLGTPELRLSYIDIVGPAGSPLSSGTVRRVLNEAVQEETFNWLIRTEGADADGDVTITTGFGRRTADGTYEFSQGSGGAEGDPDAWCPVTIPASLAGETVTSNPIDGSITVPIFDEAGVEVQVELTLRNVAIETATFGEDRSCVGWQVSRPFTYHPEGLLTGYVEVEPSRTGTINTPGVMTTVCSALAGSLSLTYCEDTPQAEWAIKPDALCDASGCQANTACGDDVCDPATECNAWRFVAHFAANGVDITNDACP